MKILKYKALIILAVLTLLAGVMTPCFGAWYNFANQKGVPEIAELRIGTVDLETLPDTLKLTVDDLTMGP